MILFVCPRQELNLHPLLRTELFYPLNYEGVAIYFHTFQQSAIVFFMTPEEKSLLERTLKLAEENNGLLKGLRRSNRVSTVMRILYWVVIIALSFGAFYLIQPYFTFLTGLTGGSSTTDGTTSGSVMDQYSPSSVQNAAASLKQLLQGQQ